MGKKRKNPKTPEKLSTYDPENLPFSRHCVCLYLQELEKEAEEREAEEKNGTTAKDGSP